MLSALIKKQMLEFNQFYFVNRKTGQRRKGLALLGYVFLYIFIFAAVAFIFGMYFKQLGDLLLHMQNGKRLYYSIVCIPAVIFGVIGSVFNTFSVLYRSKDNEFLLSMPIRPSFILLSRMIGVYLICLLYEGLVFFPAVIICMSIIGFSVSDLIFGLLIYFISAFFVLAFTCLFGWIVALISSKIKKKGIIVSILSVALFLVYYYFMSKITTLIETIAKSSDKIGSGIKTYAYPVYLMAKGLCGDISAMLIFSLICFVLFAATWFILSKTYIGIATKNQVISKNNKVQNVKVSGFKSALFKRELKHFLSCNPWMMNNGLGVLILLFAGIFLIIKSGSIDGFITKNNIPVELISNYLPFVLSAFVMLVTSMDCVTAPSVSVEGKNMWIVQSLPVSAKDVLFAKLKLNVIINLPMSIVFIIIVACIFKINLLMTILCIVGVSVFNLLSGAFGLYMNLNNCNLSWTNVVVPVKQSLPVFVSIFGGMGYIVLCGVGCFFALQVMSAVICFVLGILLNIVLTLILISYLRGKGAEKFAKLN